jgi:hypothetical protein
MDLAKLFAPSRDPARERPAFAKGFPRDPELDRLVERFARGDHAAVRQGAEALATRTDDPAVAAAARALRARLEPDRLAYVLLIFPALLLLTLSLWAIYRTHHPQAPATAPTVVKPRAQASASGVPRSLPGAPSTPR